MTNGIPRPIFVHMHNMCINMFHVKQTNRHMHMQKHTQVRANIHTHTTHTHTHTNKHSHTHSLTPYCIYYLKN